MKLNLSKLLFLLALPFLIYSGLLLWQRFAPSSLSFDRPELFNTDVQVASVSGQFRLRLPAQDIDLPITSYLVKNSRWPLSSTGLVHVAQTPLPGDVGNSIIYGHNWDKILGRLKQAKVGESIVVDREGSVFTFIITSINTVSPQDAALLQPSDSAQLTLYTCIGFLDNQRLVVSARPS